MKKIRETLMKVKKYSPIIMWICLFIEIPLAMLQSHHPSTCTTALAITGALLCAIFTIIARR